MTIVLNPNSTLAGNAPALGAFQRAAGTWQNLLADNIVVQIDAGLAVLGNPNTIGQASTTILQGSYTTVRNAIVADAADEASNAIVASLPTAAQYGGLVPQGFTLANAIVLSRANALALGFTNLPGSTDGAITFNSQFAFDFDNSDGVGSGLVDFETVALHEIGHVLGFVSAVDEIDILLSQNSPGLVAMYALDLFRFSTGNIPVNAAQFTTNPRNLVPGEAAVFSDTVVNHRFSTGVNIGDGRQASHWRDDELSGSLLGIMDPTLPAGVIQNVSAADLRAFDLIGYDLANPVPEPATIVLLRAGMAAIAFVRRRA
jgi:hypothetical protein